MNLIRVNCAQCAKEFDRSDVQVRQSKKKNKKMFCSLTCYGKSRSSNLSTEEQRLRKNELMKSYKDRNYIRGYKR